MEGFINKVTGGEKKEGEHTSRPEGHGYNQEREASGGGMMGKLGGLVGGEDGEHSKHEAQQQSSGGLMGKVNTMAGGGPESEKNEDALDKGVDWVQEHVLGQGDQSNESAIEQAKDEQISDYIRSQFKKTTGHEIPIKDKDRF